MLLATTSIRDRYHGFRKALQDYGLSSQIAELSQVDPANAEEVRRLLAASHPSTARPLAVVALHDLIAMALMSAAARIGLNPPRDFAVVGFDDLPLSSHLPIPLTTVIQPRYDIGFRAGHLLIDKIEGHPIRNDKLSLLVSLVVRESCGARRITAQDIAAAAQSPSAR
jgi:DNA-binding LacI/PurR family transcriptional regulator